MRCPNCNQWNRATLPRCFRCGTPLSTDTPVQPSWRATLKDDRAGKAYIRVDEDGGVDVTPDDREVLAAEMAELKARKDDGARRLNQLRMETAQRWPGQPYEAPEAPEEPIPEADTMAETRVHSARVAVTGAPEGGYQAPEAPAAPVRNPRGTRVIMSPEQWQDSRSYDPIVDDMQQSNVFKQPPNLQELPRTPSRRNRTRRLIRTLTILLVLVTLALAFTIGYGAWSRYQAAQQEKHQALVTASMLNDLAAHTVLIPGEDGQLIYIHELHGTYEVIGGYATIVIPDYTWYEDLAAITDESMTVTLTPYIKNAGAGQKKQISPITYDITIPLSPIDIVSPSSLRTEVTTAMYSMVFKVRPGSVVTINGVDMSDAVDENGQLVYNATVQPKGDNSYLVNVRAPYCRDNSMEVILFREVQEIPLDLDATTYTSTSLSRYQITCSTLPGADVDILSPHTDLNITDLNTTGVFTFYAVFDKIGDNTVSIQATYPGKKTSRVDYVIYYLPNQDDYTRKAWSLTNAADYSELMGNISFRAERTQIYVAMGEFSEFVTGSPQMGIMYCSADGTSQPVLLENKTKTTWKKGVTYRIYADVKGSYNGMPWLVARYCYID